MTSQEAVRLIRSLAKLERVRFSSHAEDEADRLGVAFVDVVFALAHAGGCVWQPDRDTWKVKGADRFGVTLVVIVEIQDDLIVVTVFD